VRQGAHNWTPAGVIENRLVVSRPSDCLSYHYPNVRPAASFPHRQKFHLFSPFNTYFHLLTLIKLFVKKMVKKRQSSGPSLVPGLFLKSRDKTRKNLSGFAGFCRPFTENFFVKNGQK